MDIRITNTLKEVKQKYGVLYAELKGHSRRADIIEARHYAFKVLRYKYKFTYDRIGAVFNRGHSNVYATLNYKRVNATSLKQKNPNFIKLLIDEQNRLNTQIKAVELLIKCYT